MEGSKSRVYLAYPTSHVGTQHTRRCHLQSCDSLVGAGEWRWRCICRHLLIFWRRRRDVLSRVGHEWCHVQLFREWHVRWDLLVITSRMFKPLNTRHSHNILCFYNIYFISSSKSAKFLITVYTTDAKNILTALLPEDWKRLPVPSRCHITWLKTVLNDLAVI